MVMSFHLFSHYNCSLESMQILVGNVSKANNLCFCIFPSINDKCFIHYVMMRFVLGNKWFWCVFGHESTGHDLYYSIHQFCKWYLQDGYHTYNRSRLYIRSTQSNVNFSFLWGIYAVTIHNKCVIVVCPFLPRYSVCHPHLFCSI